MHGLQSWDDLRYFLAVASEGSLSAAARQLGVNQSTVFRRIAHLEEQVAARLFDRQPRGYVLTAVGEQMLPLALQVQEDVVAVGRSIVGADQAVRGVVRVTTVLELFEVAAPHLARFQSLHPGVELEISTTERVVSLAHHEADVALRPGLAPTEPDVIGRRLVSLGLAAYASPAYLEAHGRPSGPDELSQHAIIEHRRVVSPAGRVALGIDSKVGQAIAARAGLGVTVLPVFMGDPDPALVRLFRLPVDQVYLWLLIHADLRQTARVRTFVDFMTEALVADAATFEGA